MQPNTKGCLSGPIEAKGVAEPLRRPLSRRNLLLAGAAAGGAAVLGPRDATRRAAARQGIEGEVGVRFFPFGPGVEDLYQSFADEFRAENPGVEVRLDLQPWDGRYPKMLADLAAGQGPDVMFVTTDVLIRFSESGVLEPLDDALPAAAWDGYGADALDEVSYQGSRWFAPMDQEMPIWMTNPAIFERAGLDPAQPPGTWDEIRELCRRVQAAGDPNLYGWGYSAASATLNTTFYPFLYQAGGRPLSEDGSEPTFNSEAGVEALSFIVELFEQGWAPQQYLQPIEEGQDPFILGTQAISVHEFVAELINVRQNAPDLRAGLTPMLGHKESWGFGGMRSWAMSRSARNKEAAAAFLAFLVRPEITARHAQAFGVFPLKPQALDLAYRDDPELAALQERLPRVFGEQKHKYGRDLMPLVTPEIQGAILGQKTPKQALDDAAVQVRELFARG